MLKTYSVDLEKIDYTRYFNAIKASLKTHPLPSSDDPTYFSKLKDRLAGIFDPEYIIIVSESLEYNIQTLKATAWIFSIHSAKVIAYKPKPISFPQLLKCPPVTPEDTSRYLTNNSDPQITSSKLLQNTLFPEAQAQELMDLVRTVLNKLGDQSDPVTQMMVYAKQFCLFHLESIFIHIVVGNSDSLQVALPSDTLHAEGVEEAKEAIFDFEFKLKGQKTKKRLLIFEKKGRVDSFRKRFSSKWKEVILILGFIMTLLVLTKCSTDSPDYMGMDLQAVCRNKNLLIYVLVFMAAGFILVRHFRKTKERIANLKAKKME